MRPRTEITAERVSAIHSAMLAAPSKSAFQRLQCLWLRASQELSTEAIAQAVGLSVSHVRRVRSCSMNLQCGTVAIPGGNTYGAGQYNGVNYKEFMKYSDFGRGGLSASDCFVFLDENPLSLNDGWFLYILDGSEINDRPAVNHGHSSSFSFADGHAELQLWHDVFLTTDSSGQGDDTLWLAQHGTYPLK